MKAGGLKKFLGILNSKPVIGMFIFVMLSLTMVFAGNVIVKEGSIDVEDSIYVDNNLTVSNVSAELVSSDLVSSSNGVFSSRVLIGSSGSPVSALQLNYSGYGDISDGLTFGDGDSGFYEDFDDQIQLSVAGSSRVQFTSGVMQSQTYNSWAFLNEGASATNPVFSPRNTDIDSGVGSSGSDSISLISGGVEGIRISESSGDITATVNGDLDVYDVDTNGATLISESGTAILETFYVKKPITAYSYFSNPSGMGGYQLEIYQNSDWRVILSESSTTYTYNLQLNPGYYRINAGGVSSVTVTLYGTGVYGSDEVVASDIIG